MTDDDQTNIRDADRSDVPAIVALLADDVLGAGRERAGGDDLAAYYAAFDDVAADPNNTLIVAAIDGLVVGCLQLTIIPGLSISATRRGQIEGVRVAADRRGSGLGERMIRHAVDIAEQRGCGLVQLTSNKVRKDAIRFYERLGFQATHEGFKMPLPQK